VFILGSESHHGDGISRDSLSNMDIPNNQYLQRIMKRTNTTELLFDSSTLISMLHLFWNRIKFNGQHKWQNCS